MASRSFADEDVSCPVCCDIFINPVLLSCSHSFCSSCIQRFWGNKGLKECPICRRTSSNDDPPLNLALRNLCESFQQRSSSEGETVCSVHREKLKLFCLDDQQPVCVVCRDSRKHTDHRFCPIDEAVVKNKGKLRYSLDRLQEKLGIFESFKWTLDQTAQQIKIQTQDTVIQMTVEFEELHQFLHDEEVSRITALREEEEQKSWMMKEKIEEMSKQISSLISTIRHIEEQMKTEDVSFLQNFKSTSQRAEIRLPDPQNITETISVPKHTSNLKLTVLQQMQDNVAKALCITAELSDDQYDDRRFGVVSYPSRNCIKSAQSRRKDSKMFWYKESKEGPQQFPEESLQGSKNHNTNIKTNLDSKDPQSSGYACSYEPSRPLLTPVHDFNQGGAAHRPLRNTTSMEGESTPPPPVGTQFQPRGSHPPQTHQNPHPTQTCHPPQTHQNLHPIQTCHPPQTHQNPHPIQNYHPPQTQQTPAPFIPATFPKPNKTPTPFKPATLPKPTKTPTPFKPATLPKPTKTPTPFKPATLPKPTKTPTPFKPATLPKPTKTPTPFKPATLPKPNKTLVPLEPSSHTTSMEGESTPPPPIGTQFQPRGSHPPQTHQNPHPTHTWHPPQTHQNLHPIQNCHPPQTQQNPAPFIPATLSKPNKTPTPFKPATLPKPNKTPTPFKPATLPKPNKTPTPFIPATLPKPNKTPTPFIPATLPKPNKNPTPFKPATLPKPNKTPTPFKPNKTHHPIQTCHPPQTHQNPRPTRTRHHPNPPKPPPPSNPPPQTRHPKCRASKS